MEWPSVLVPTTGLLPLHLKVSSHRHSTPRINSYYYSRGISTHSLMVVVVVLVVVVVVMVVF